ncbi:hypothetical protein [Variovorax saccharolyticus]|uniref:hypothetical protein n=1 Tax=Variovorax saccharolyticus TaxID=3053516 RepID=UPI002576171B|nr:MULTISPECIES: hypothetical protein [unclassified Variovorax]MDM0020660.1 hypothetical protein [Variovorax sp. J22R187]MDM0025781.1 hypothetical protein [Variovorax sp. J31P216]
METMGDEELAAAAYVLRKRAELGDPDALEQARRMEAELSRRLGSTPSGHGPLEPEAKPARPWWRFW